MPLQYSHDKDPWETTFESPGKQINSWQEAAKSRLKKQREEYLINFLLWVIAIGVFTLIFFNSIYN